MNETTLSTWNSMTSSRWLAALCLVLGGTSMAYGFQDPAPKSESPQQAHQLESDVPIKLNYLVTLPKGYEAGEKWPVVLFLHGAGERGDDLERVKVHGPPKLVEAGRDFPFILIAPQCPEGQWWENVELTGLLDAVCENYKVDEDRVYVTGLSMGGFGTWSLAHYSPERFAAIAPICGGGVPYWTKEMASLPAWVFHGAKDTVIPVSFSQDMVTALEKVQGDVRLTIYPEASHDSWTETYNNDKLYEWLLTQRRRPVVAVEEPAPPSQQKTPESVEE